MRAAVVTSPTQSPRYAEVPEPEPVGRHEIVVDMVAVALSPRVKARVKAADDPARPGLPLVPGIDGVGRTSDGRLLYFELPAGSLGSLAERTVIDLRRSIELPVDVDAVTLAAAMDPALSSWVALRGRGQFLRAHRVMVLGATGNAGRLAVQVARNLGAAHVVAVGRDAGRLADLAAHHADATVSLEGDADAVTLQLALAGRDVDVVLDYLWGRPTADALRAIVPARAEDGRLLTWIHVGSGAGSDFSIPSEARGTSRLKIVGSGLGSMSSIDLVAELSSLASEIHRGRFFVDAAPVPLPGIAQIWRLPLTGPRLVVVP